MDKKVVASLCIFSVLTGLLIGKIFFGKKNENIVEQRSKGEYKYISPLLECDNVELSDKASVSGLKYRLEDYILKEKDAGNLTNASVYYRDLNSGPWMGINEREFFSPASMVKVPLMMAYFKVAENDPNILTKEMEFDKEEDPNLIQEIKPSVAIEPSKKYTVADLIERMIVYSDNDAYELLMKNIDNSVLYRVYSDVGIDIASASKKDPGGNILTVRDNAAFYRILYNASYLTKKYSEEALVILAKSQFKDGIRKYIPESIAVSHKFGERAYPTGEKQFHDCGIVYHLKHPYLLCVMTRGKDSQKLISSIAEISRETYKYLSGLTY